MSGGDVATDLCKCPLFTGRHSDARADAQWLYSENYLHGVNGGVLFYRKKDVVAPRSFFRLSDDCSTVFMAAETQQEDCASVYAVIQMVVSVITCANNSDAASMVDVLTAVCDKVLRVSFKNSPHWEQNFANLIVERAVVLNRYKAVCHQTTVQSLRMGIVFGWMLTLIATNTNHVKTILDLFQTCTK